MHMIQTWDGRAPMLLSLSWPTCHPSVPPTVKSMRYTPMTIKSLIMWIIRKKNQLHFYNLKREDFYLRKGLSIDSYLDEIVCLKNANKVARDILQRFNMPTETIPMLFKKPKKATADLHKDLLGTRNPGLGYMAKRAQPALYDADTLLHLTHPPVSTPLERLNYEAPLLYQTLRSALHNDEYGD
ncbi:hypothetical protein Tco_0752954 [Tanacetum coccineum]